MNAGNGMVAFLSWLLAILRGFLWHICPQLAWPARLGLGDFSPHSPCAFLVFLSHQLCALDPTHGWWPRAVWGSPG